MTTPTFPRPITFRSKGGARISFSTYRYMTRWGGVGVVLADPTQRVEPGALWRIYGFGYTFEGLGQRSFREAKRLAKGLLLAAARCTTEQEFQNAVVIANGGKR